LQGESNQNLLYHGGILIGNKEKEMKKTIAALAGLAVLGTAVVGLSGCNYVGVRADAPKDFDFQDFTRVNVSSAFHVEIAHGDAYDITVIAPRVENVRVEKNGDVLRVYRDASIWCGPFNAESKVEITLPNLTAVELSGASHGTVSGFDQTSDLDVRVSGASHLELANTAVGDFTADVSGASRLNGEVESDGQTGLVISGASRVDLNGSASEVKVSASGASRAALIDYTVENADVTLGGASHGEVNLTGRLDANISGASRLNYRGTPELGTVQTSGSSTVSRT
jgi:hypothetical protein